MPLCCNPGQRRLRVPVGQAAVILVLRDYTAEEFARFLSGRFEFKRRGRIEDRSMQARVRFVDDLLVGIEARDAEGRPDTVTYRDPATGEQNPLTPAVPDWKRFVNPSWKIAAALELEGVAAETEHDTLKN